MEENLDNWASAEIISTIIDRVLSEIQALLSRFFYNVYAIVWIYLHCKVMDCKNHPVTRVIYNILDINNEDYKDLLCNYFAKSERANFWLSCLSNLEFDILIPCCDNLTGFVDTIKMYYPRHDCSDLYCTSD